MGHPTSTDLDRYTVDAYFGLVARGELSPDDHVELLDGVIIAEPPSDPDHASGTTRMASILETALHGRAVVRVQLPLLLRPYSAPEPDVAVIAGSVSDYDRVHPSTALLVVEVSRSSLPQDRLSKARVYATASIPEYWIVNLRDDCVETMRSPNPAARSYRQCRTVGRGECLSLVSFPDVMIRVDEILPA